MKSVISGWILKLLGWKIVGDWPHDKKQLVVVVMHHTSNWDFPLGLLVRMKLRANINFVMKSSMFKPPFGWIFKLLGGYPVERNVEKKRISMVDALCHLYEQEERLCITFTPEGTRSKVTSLRTGFYHIARKCQIPIILVDFDFSTKYIKLDEPHMPMKSFEEEYQILKSFYEKSKGLHRELGFEFNDLS